MVGTTHGPPRVLIVDDDDDIRDTLADILDAEGYRSIPATNGKEALRILTDGVGPCVLLLDLMMPVMNGWELLDVIRKTPALAATPVVAITAGRQPAPLANRLLHKPLEADELLEVLRSVCEAS
jgi:CheY-like chemotaxis protein